MAWYRYVGIRGVYKHVGIILLINMLGLELLLYMLRLESAYRYVGIRVCLNICWE